MIQQMFSVYDSKARAFILPFFTPNLQVAARAFAECANDPTHAFGRHPEDYTLYHLGSFNDELGELEVLPKSVSLGMAANYRTSRLNNVAKPEVTNVQE